MPVTRVGVWLLFEGGFCRRLRVREWLAIYVLRVPIMAKR